MLLENEYIAKPFLHNRYRKRDRELATQEAFRNVHAFCCYLRQGRALLAATSPLTNWVEPLTLYYSMINLLKATLLTLDPTYPQQTSLLRHGCTTRKKKRHPYRFLHDEIRIQKEGLFPYLLSFFALAQPVEGRFTPQRLLGMIPDLSDPFQMLTGKQTMEPLQLQSEQTTITLLLSEQILDYAHLSLPAWLNRFLRVSPTTPAPLQAQANDGKIELCWSAPTSEKGITSWRIDHPWIFRNTKGAHYLWYDNERPYSDTLPDIGVLYMLLFTLSMLARYDSPLWGELLLDSAEAAIIQPLFRWVKRWLPQFIYEVLHQEPIQLHVH